MDGIYEEVPLAELQRLARLDPVASAELGQDVVYAVQTGCELIDLADCGCLDVGDYTTDDDLHGSAAMLFYAGVGSGFVVAFLAFAAVLILASGWTL